MTYTRTHHAIGPVLAVVLAACGARSPLIVPTTEAGAPDAPALDASIDAPPDSPPDALPRECENDRQCNDGVMCTEDRCDLATGRCVLEPHDERCDDPRACDRPLQCVPRRGCVAGPSRPCSDGVACTRDSCDATVNRCTFTPDDTLCPLSHGCDPALGCFARALAHGPEGLFDIRLPSGEATRRFSLPGGLTDIALRPDGSLWAVARGFLYRLDVNTGFVLEQIDFTGIELTALDAAPDGTLYAGAGPSVYRFDMSSRVFVRVARFPEGLQASGDVAFYEGRLLATARTDEMSLDTLVEFDVPAGTSRTIGPVGFRCVWGLAAFGATLYGLSCNGEVLRVDPNTGAGTLLERSSHGYYGATAR